MEHYIQAISAYNPGSGATAEIVVGLDSPITVSLTAYRCWNRTDLGFRPIHSVLIAVHRRNPCNVLAHMHGQCE